jgi:hypothetical protein
MLKSLPCACAGSRVRISLNSVTRDKHRADALATCCTFDAELAAMCAVTVVAAAAWPAALSQVLEAAATELAAASAAAFEAAAAFAVAVAANWVVMIAEPAEPAAAASAPYTAAR